MVQAGEDLPPSCQLIVHHTIRSQLDFWPANTEYGKKFREMSHEERLAEVEKTNRGPDEENDDGENVNEEQKATKAKKSDKDVAEDRNDENYEEEGDEDESDDEDEELTPVKKHPAVSKLGRGRPHKSFSPTGNSFSNDFFNHYLNDYLNNYLYDYLNNYLYDYLNDYLNDYSTFYLCSRRKLGARFPAVGE